MKGQIRAIVHNDEKEILIKIEKYNELNELPPNIQRKRQKKINNNKSLWLVEEDFCFIFKNNLISKLNVFFGNNNNNNINQYDYFINEIIYKKSGVFTTRPIESRQPLPCEYIQELYNPKNLPVKKFFLDLYYDDFGTYRTVYHSLGGVYLQFGNMPFHQRKLLKNHFIIGFVPFGATFSEFIQPFLRDIKKLEKGILMKINGEEYLITGGLGVVTADLPQGNDLCGVKRHGANHGCRNCFVPRENLSDNNYDHLQNTRYLQQIKKLRQKYNLLKNMQEKKDFATKYGLSIEPSPLSSLQWNPFIQIPQDPYHAISGKIARLLDSTLEILSQNGKKNLIKFWKYFEFPSYWSRMQNPISHSKSFYMSDCQRLAMIFPFILQHFLAPEYIKKEVFEKMKTATSLNSNNLIKKIIECWVRIAKCTRLVFSSYFRNKDDYNNLDIMLREESECLIKVSLISYKINKNIIIYNL